jgi:N6-L-threonylcarbamoyladenine synthase
VAINHLHAHIYACRMAAGREIFPCVGLIVSGGHTSLYLCAAPTEFEYLGGTIDDAAGEAFDKVAAMLGLSYPGGPAISRAAETGDPRAFAFPRGLASESKRLDFSFSGPGKPDFSQLKLPPQRVADIAASFQEAVVDALVGRSLLALEQTGLARLCVGGGVAANRRLRERLAAAADEERFELIIAPPELCTDNAVMGAIAFERLKAGKVESLELDIVPGLVRHG